MTAGTGGTGSTEPRPPQGEHTGDQPATPQEQAPVALWDERNQSLDDKIFSTLVVRA